MTDQCRKYKWKADYELENAVRQSRPSCFDSMDQAEEKACARRCAQRELDEREEERQREEEEDTRKRKRREELERQAQNRQNEIDNSPDCESCGEKMMICGCADA